MLQRPHGGMRNLGLMRKGRRARHVKRRPRPFCAPGGKKRGAAVVMLAEIVNKIFRIVFGGNNNVLKCRTECGFNSTFVFLRNG